MPQNMQRKRKSIVQENTDMPPRRKRKLIAQKKYNCTKINLDLHTFTLEQLELINDYIKDECPNFELVDGKLAPVSYAPIAIEAVVHEISRQLGNWNVKIYKNGVVTTSKGGFDFDTSGHQKIRAPDIAFTPGSIYRSLNEEQLWSFQGQPFTPVFIVEVANLAEKDVEKSIDTRIKKDYFAKGTSVELGWLLDPINHIIWVYKRNINGKPYRRQQDWDDLYGDKFLPGFILELWQIENIVMQEVDYEDDGSNNKVGDGKDCPYCDTSFDEAHELMVHLAKKHIK